NPLINKLKDLSNEANNKLISAELRKTIQLLKDNPHDYVVEIQIQDLASYLQGITKGSPADHSALKMNQVRKNSFYKFFPAEIYEEDLQNLKKQILTGAVDFIA
ncbi:MAG TPA: hypothetical protein PLQ36_02795, partial [Candidatus Gracilibacteria bacterium]|nr:hypothetical protein [Candidatus Gracilibacteria bacterium]